jgi:hypothetical protein
MVRVVSMRVGAFMAISGNRRKPDCGERFPAWKVAVPHGGGKTGGGQSRKLGGASPPETAMTLDRRGFLRFVGRGARVVVAWCVAATLAPAFLAQVA